MTGIKTRIGWRGHLAFFALLVTASGSFGLIALFSGDWPRWIGFALAGLSLSMALDQLLLLLPRTRLREAVRLVVALPTLVFIAGSAAYNVFIALFLWFMTVTLFIGLASLAIPTPPFAAPPLLYVSLLTTICIASYAGDRVLLPLKWLSYFTSGPDSEDARFSFDSAVLVVRSANFRRLAYVLSIAAYVLTTLNRLSRGCSSQ